jgi:hypothetical protein
MRLRWASSAVFAARNCTKFAARLQLRDQSMSLLRDNGARARDNTSRVMLNTH